MHGTIAVRDATAIRQDLNAARQALMALWAGKTFDHAAETILRLRISSLLRELRGTR